MEGEWAVQGRFLKEFLKDSLSKYSVSSVTFAEKIWQKVMSHHKCRGGWVQEALVTSGTAIIEMVWTQQHKTKGPGYTQIKGIYSIS